MAQGKLRFSAYSRPHSSDNGQVTINGIEVAKSEVWKNQTAAFIDDNSYRLFNSRRVLPVCRSIEKGDQKTATDFLSQFEEFFNGEVLNQKKYIRDFSKGNQKKIGLAAAFIGQPELIS